VQNIYPNRGERAEKFSKANIQRKPSIGRKSGMVTINQNTQEKSERSNIKKKTVIFANSKESSGSNIAYVRSGSRKGTKYSNASKQSKITNKAKRHIHQKLTRFKG